MRLALASTCLLVSIVFSAFAQQPPKQRIPLIGTVESVSSDTIHVKTRAEILTLHSDSQTAVWKGKKSQDFSQIEAGDRISADAERVPDGSLVAIAVWVNYTNFCAVITSLKGDALEVLTNPDADTYSGYRKEKKLVQVDRGTVFESGSKQDLRVGRVVSVVGLDLKGGEVQAKRIGIVGMDGEKRNVLPLTGPPK